MNDAVFSETADTSISSNAKSPRSSSRIAYEDICTTHRATRRDDRARRTTTGMTSIGGRRYSQTDCLRMAERNNERHTLRYRTCPSIHRRLALLGDSSTRTMPTWRRSSNFIISRMWWARWEYPRANKLFRVSTTYIRRRISSSAIDRFFETDALHRACLEVRASNEIARRLYERAHFVLEGTWRDGFRDHDGSFHDLCAYGLLKSEYDDGVAHSAR